MIAARAALLLPLAGCPAVTAADLADRLDADGDGYEAVVFGGLDCDDDDPGVHPGVDHDPLDGVDADCDGLDQDLDGDGWAPPDDCDDLDPFVNPGVQEAFHDGLDSDCDGADDYDADGDGHRARGFPDGDDCDDTEPAVHPGADDVLGDGVDSDCDGRDG